MRRLFRWALGLWIIATSLGVACLLKKDRSVCLAVPSYLGATGLPCGSVRTLRVSSYDLIEGYPLFSLDGARPPRSGQRWVPHAKDLTPTWEVTFSQPVSISAVILFAFNSLAGDRAQLTCGSATETEVSFRPIQREVDLASQAMQLVPCPRATWLRLALPRVEGPAWRQTGLYEVAFTTDDSPSVERGP